MRSFAGAQDDIIQTQNDKHKVSTMNFLHLGNTQSYESETDILICSIQSHLTQLLNTRAGSLNHMPDYGIPDLLCIYQFSSEALSGFISSIKKTIEKYEPRLNHLCILANQTKETDYILQLKISGTIDLGANVLFDTYWLPNGEKIIKRDQTHA